MIFKYFVEFDDEGGIAKLYKNKYEAKQLSGKKCKEYVVKLIPIDRSEELKQSVDKTTKSIEGVNTVVKKLQSEIEKAVKNMRGFKI